IQMRVLILAFLCLSLALSVPVYSGVAHKRHTERIASETEIAELRDLIKSGKDNDTRIKVCGIRLFQLIRSFAEVPCTNEPDFVVDDNLRLTDKCCHNECSFGELKNYICLIYS
ncbi:hypothetical protein PENTCL1PPCAC_4143, partial [Pristionchus entomophagus]